MVIDGNNVKEYPFSQLRKKVGMVPQQAVLFKGTIRDNMKWGKEDASEEEIQRALSIAQASGFVKMCIRDSFCTSSKPWIHGNRRT